MSILLFVWILSFTFDCDNFHQLPVFNSVFFFKRVFSSREPEQRPAHDCHQLHFAWRGKVKQNHLPVLVCYNQIPFKTLQIIIIQFISIEPDDFSYTVFMVCLVHMSRRLLWSVFGVIPVLLKQKETVSWKFFFSTFLQQRSQTGFVWLNVWRKPFYFKEFEFRKA